MGLCVLYSIICVRVLCGIFLLLKVIAGQFFLAVQRSVATTFRDFILVWVSVCALFDVYFGILKLVKVIGIHELSISRIFKL